MDAIREIERLIGRTLSSNERQRVEVCSKTGTLRSYVQSLRRPEEEKLESLAAASTTSSSVNMAILNNLRAFAEKNHIKPSTRQSVFNAGDLLIGRGGVFTLEEGEGCTWVLCDDCVVDLNGGTHHGDVLIGADCVEGKKAVGFGISSIHLCNGRVTGSIFVHESSFTVLVEDVVCDGDVIYSETSNVMLSNVLTAEDSNVTISPEGGTDSSYLPTPAVESPSDQSTLCSSSEEDPSETPPLVSPRTREAD